jgi:hypothetical protein
VSEPRSALEEKVVEAALGARDEVVGLVTELVAGDATARLPGQPARDGVRRPALRPPPDAGMLLAELLAALEGDVWPTRARRPGGS